MRRINLPALTFLALVISAGAIHGFRTDRWSTSEELQLAVERLQTVPAPTGDWTEVEAVEYDAETMARGGIKGYLGRRYRNRSTDEEVSMLIVCGRGGPITAHTPDVCYAGAGYRLSGSKQHWTSETGAEFWYGRFVKPNALVPQRLDIFWAWSLDGANWSAPESERTTFARFPALYKLYVVRKVPDANAQDHTPVNGLLRELVPTLKTALTRTTN